MAVNSTPDFSIDIDGTIVARIKNYFENPYDWDIEYWDFEFNKGIIHSSVYPQKIGFTSLVPKRMCSRTIWL